MKGEKEPVPQILKDAYDSFPSHTKYWLNLDLENRLGTDIRSLERLTFFAFGIFLLPADTKREWSLRKLKQNLYARTGRQWPRTYVEEASDLALYEFVEKGVLERAGSQRFAGEPINRDTKFSLTKNKTTIVEGINCMIMAGYAAGFKDSELVGLRERAERAIKGISES